MEEATKRRGRPPKPEAEIKRHNISLSTTKTMRDRLADAAMKVGRSQSAEIEYRLQMSFALEDDAGGPSVRRLVDFVRLAAAKIEDDYEALWTDNPAAAVALHGAIKNFIDINRGVFHEAGEDALRELGRDHQAATWKLADPSLGDEEREEARARRQEVSERFWPVFHEHHEKVSELERAGVRATADLAELFRLRK